MNERHPANAPGDWYVDRRCIDCDAAREVAPGLIVARDGQSVFARQPATPEEVAMAWRARLLCPTASVRAAVRGPRPGGLFPQPLADSVWRLGYNARSSWGAHSYLVCRPAGNVMVDSPRWTEAAVAAIAARGGLSDILLTHRDDVADGARYARRFAARVWIHEADRDAAPFADRILRGEEPTAVAEDILAIPVPGHTAGSTVYLHGGRHLFSGDSLAWSRQHGDLVAFRDACWHSWVEQTRSLRRLLDHSFEWVFAGHGGSGFLPAPLMRERLAALVERMAGS
ncbi:MAG: ferredoxin [Rhodospirillaceae bacterium]|nr:ferredoxin [Rhodospirillaceae bacterium]